MKSFFKFAQACGFGFTLLSTAAFAVNKPPKEFNCQSLDFPVYTGGKGSKLKFIRDYQSIYHFLTLETFDHVKDPTSGSTADYDGLDVIVGNELEKISFRWSSGSNSGQDAFADAYSLDLNWNSYEYNKTIVLEVKHYQNNSSEMLTNFYEYKCE